MARPRWEPSQAKITAECDRLSSLKCQLSPALNLRLGRGPEITDILGYRLSNYFAISRKEK